MDQYDDEEGLPEKLVIKNQQYHKYVPAIVTGHETTCELGH